MENAINLAIGIGRQLKQLQTVYESLTESIKSTMQVDEGSMRLYFLIHKDFQNITWAPTYAMLADVLTKDKVDPTPLIKDRVRKNHQREKGGSRSSLLANSCQLQHSSLPPEVVSSHTSASYSYQFPN